MTEWLTWWRMVVFITTLESCPWRNYVWWEKWEDSVWLRFVCFVSQAYRLRRLFIVNIIQFTDRHPVSQLDLSDPLRFLVFPGGKPTGVLCGEPSAPLRRGGNPGTNHSADAPTMVRSYFRSWVVERKVKWNLRADKHKGEATKEQTGVGILHLPLMFHKGMFLWYQ